MRKTTFTDIDFSDFSSFIFKVNHVFREEKYHPLEKVVIDKQELNGIEIDDIWNLENLPRTVSMDYEYWNLKVVVYEGDLILEILIKRRRQRPFTSL